MVSIDEFNALTQDEQIANLKILGLAALREFEVQPTSIDPLVHFENTTFRVQSPQGEFNLRISRPGNQSDENIRSEIEFLSALRREGFRVPNPWQDRVVKVGVEEVPEERNVVLFTWMNGEFLRDRLTPREAPLIGQAMAEVHEFVMSWTPPEGFARQRLHQWVHEDPNDSLVNEPVDGLPEADRAMVNQIVHETCSLHRTLSTTKETHNLIHADLHVGNLLLEGDHLNIIDFDDTGFAFLYYDFAAALAFHLNDPGYLGIQTALLKGYEDVRPLPTGSRELLQPFIRQRLGGVSQWILTRTDNPKLREIGPSWVHSFCEGMRRLEAISS